MIYEFTSDNYEGFNDLLEKSYNDILYSVEFIYEDCVDSLTECENKSIQKKAEAYMESEYLDSNNTAFEKLYKQFMKFCDMSERIIFMNIQDNGDAGSFGVKCKIKGNINIRNLLDILSTVSGYDLCTADDIFDDMGMISLKMTKV